MNFFFSEAARVEHLEHVAYYEEQRPGLGARYPAAFDAAMITQPALQAGESSGSVSAGLVKYPIETAC